MDKDHFCYELFNVKENLSHDRHRYFSFLSFSMILWNVCYRNHILRVWTFPPKASRRRGRETWQVRLIPIEFFRYALHIPTYSRYLDRFTWLSYIHYIYILHCALASLWRYIYRVIELCTHHRTFTKPPWNSFFRITEVERIFATRMEIPVGAVTNVQISLRNVYEFQERFTWIFVEIVPVRYRVTEVFKNKNFDSSYLKNSIKIGPNIGKKIFLYNCDIIWL